MVDHGDFITYMYMHVYLMLKLGNNYVTVTFIPNLAAINVFF